MYRKINIILIVCTIAIMSFCFLKDRVKDKDAPVISFEGKEMVYNEGDDDVVLLADVSVSDNKDKEVTVIVDSKIILSDGEHMMVKYVAVDSHNNVAEKKRIVNYKMKASANGSEGESNDAKGNDAVNGKAGSEAENNDVAEANDSAGDGVGAGNSAGAEAGNSAGAVAGNSAGAEADNDGAKSVDGTGSKDSEQLKEEILKELEGQN